MPLLLDPNDPARTDDRTGAATLYVRVDHLHMTAAPDRIPEVAVKIGIYTNGAAAGAGKEPPGRSREILLRPAQAQALVDLVTDRIYQVLSAAGGPFPNATIV